MNERVTRDELLYRVVKRSCPDAISEDGHPTPALFKDDAGVSVGRDGDRAESAILTSFRSIFQARFRGLVKVCAAVCLDHNMAVIPEPTSDEYHAAIYNDFQQTPLNPLNALILADAAEVVVYEKPLQLSNSS